MLYEKDMPDSIDLGHHLSVVSRNRTLSPLKGLQKYFGKPGILSLAGGLPSPEYFPFERVGADILVAKSYADNSTSKGTFAWIWDFFSSKASTVPISVPKYPESPEDVNLATALQYGLARGLPQLQGVINELTSRIYQPAYANFVTLIHAGNTDGWMKIVTTLCNPGEGVLCSEWTYPSALATMVPYGIRSVPVKMDVQGMSSTSLRKTLTEWDEKGRGMRRPHVMYVVPVGQNPTGATMGAERKKEIYSICVEFDVIIVEDDPYYFLQEGPYRSPSQRLREQQTEMTDEKYIASLAPSFLKFDYQGRVVRLDTFSKIIAPGSRLGWFTCNPIFAERLERQGETSTQAPSGFGQSLITQLLLNWQFKGCLQWLKGLGLQYKQRRDFFIDCLFEKFHLEMAPAPYGLFEGTPIYFASQMRRGYRNEKADTRVLFSFVPPTSGMFIWFQLHFDGHPQLRELGQETLEMKLWTALAEGGLLIGPGSMFSADKAIEMSSQGHFRLSFSNATYDDLKKAVDIFEKVLREFHENA
ncbi:pyridoxal phosphate-dependent transferase [Gymnopilus junonius]|uniref:Pyridoxal phosphate-dependent transferase n=1 Tax=Gymnopilus junonius TaxID=109634 RepID=A0A9P5NZE0_GYMJU|nr:pyridoxal phosphate-dependent transferase [Gymnopilus junonius]